MSNEPLKYRAISAIKGEIYCSLDFAQQMSSIELFEDNQESYKIFAVLSSSNDRTVLRQLILEKIFYSKQDYKDFRVYAQEHINRYFSRIKFLSGEHSATIDNSNRIECPEGQYGFAEAGSDSGCSVKILVFLTKSDYERLGRVKDESIDEYVKRYNLTIQFTDSVLRLISLCGIAELIVEENKIEANVFFDDLVYSTRHLVAHGVVNRPSTLKGLIKALGTASEFKFSREDKKQMDLVEESASKIAVKLKQYLEAQLTKI